jgi:hypothetical protein
MQVNNTVANNIHFKTYESTMYLVYLVVGGFGFFGHKVPHVLCIILFLLF